MYPSPAEEQGNKDVRTGMIIALVNATFWITIFWR